MDSRPFRGSELEPRLGGVTLTDSPHAEPTPQGSSSPPCPLQRPSLRSLIGSKSETHAGLDRPRLGPVPGSGGRGWQRERCPCQSAAWHPRSRPPGFSGRARLYPERGEDLARGGRAGVQLNIMKMAPSAPSAKEPTCALVTSSAFEGDSKDRAALAVFCTQMPLPTRSRSTHEPWRNGPQLSPRTLRPRREQRSDRPRPLGPPQRTLKFSQGTRTPTSAAAALPRATGLSRRCGARGAPGVQHVCVLAGSGSALQQGLTTRVRIRGEEEPEASCKRASGMTPPCLGQRGRVVPRLCCARGPAATDAGDKS